VNLTVKDEVKGLETAVKWKIIRRFLSRFEDGSYQKISL